MFIAHTITFVMTILAVVTSFTPPHLRLPHSATKILKATWQEDLDGILDIDTDWSSRKSLTKSFLGKLKEVTSDVADSIRERDVRKVAPKNLAYGKAVAGLQDFQNQLISDIIPDILTKGVPKLVDEGPRVLQKFASQGPSVAVSKGRRALSAAQKLSQDPNKLQSAFKDIRREIRNLVKSTPEGLETPPYDVVQERESYQIRRYSGYSVCSAPMTSKCLSGEEKADAGDNDSTMGGSYYDNGLEMDPMVLSSSFNTLARYIFGANTGIGEDDEDDGIESDSGKCGEKLRMTTPVIMDEERMSFVLPTGLTSATAPTPTSKAVQLRDVEGGLWATREFTGYTTEGEISRQRAKLEDSLMEDEIVYAAESFQVLNYNPPFTVPWVRRNEVSFRLITPASELPPPPPGSQSTTSSSTTTTTTTTTTVIPVMGGRTDGTDGAGASSAKDSSESVVTPAAAGAAAGAGYTSADSASGSSEGRIDDENLDEETVFFSAPEAGD